jgi:3'-phosphoadenosine 5'-phosphosulfate sulfotransferase (PAPS reductase)/FAD synthetase
MSTLGTDSDNSRKGGFEAAWHEASKCLSAHALSGLLIRCPACRRRGTLTSKWEPGTPIKPLYVLHGNGNGYLKACRVDREDARAARDSISITSNDVLKTLRLGQPFVLFSGGRDSLCTLEYMRKLGKRVGVEITALHADTTAGFPEVETYVKDVCRKLAVPLVTLRPERDYFETAKKWGIPGVRSRWCCKTLKVAPIRRYLSQIDGPKVIFDGIRAAESPIRATYVPVWFHPAFRCFSVSPIFYWSNRKVDGYIERSGLPANPTLQLGCSGECWCGAYKSRTDFEALLDVHPEIFSKLVEVEKAQRGKFTFLYENGHRVPLTSLRRKKRSR